jgi:lipopolysaccharide transport system ATP-binding protein
MSSPVIRVQNVTQRFRLIQERPDSLRELFAKAFRHNAQYHDFDALQNVSFDVHEGEMVGIVGRNGSGKSTLLKVVAGVYKPSFGSVEVRGSLAPLIELGLLMVFSKREMQFREAGILEFAEIGDFIDAPVKQYSSGMYMRLAFAVATEVDPDILVVDEILAVGDEPFQRKCFERIERFRRSGKTILFVTHSMQQVVDHCDRAIYLDGGKVVVDGMPERVVDLYFSANHIEHSPLEHASHS